MELEYNEILSHLNNPNFRNCHLLGNGVIREVEDKLKEYYGKKFVVTFPNATTAIWALCFALNFKRKVIATCPFGWAGAISPFLYLENSLSFSGVDKSLNISPSKMNLEKKKVSAIFSIDFGGIPADTRNLKEKALRNGLFLISDSSQSFGAFRDGKPAGYFADAIILSFTSTKSINCLEGGAIVTDDANIYKNIISLSQHPYRQKVNFGLESFNEFLPVNGRMNPFSALILNKTLNDQLNILNEVQKKYFDVYQKLVQQRIIKSIRELTNPKASTFFEFIVESFGQDKELMRKLNNTYSDFYFTNTQLIPFQKRDGFMEQFKSQVMLNNNNTGISNRIKITLKT